MYTRLRRLELGPGKESRLAPTRVAAPAEVLRESGGDANRIYPFARPTQAHVNRWIGQDVVVGLCEALELRAPPRALARAATPPTLCLEPQRPSLKLDA